MRISGKTMKLVVRWDCQILHGADCQSQCIKLARLAAQWTHAYRYKYDTIKHHLIVSVRNHNLSFSFRSYLVHRVWHVPSYDASESKYLLQLP